jgi:acetyl-CoA acetyltransferase
MFVKFIAHLAHESGYFKQEIVSIKVNDPRKGEIIFDRDERARQMTLEKLSKIPPAFKKNGLITVASASVSHKNKIHDDQVFRVLAMEQPRP